jgi:hypothetical protein
VIIRKVCKSLKYLGFINRSFQDLVWMIAVVLSWKFALPAGYIAYAKYSFNWKLSAYACYSFVQFKCHWLITLLCCILCVSKYTILILKIVPLWNFIFENIRYLNYKFKTAFNNFHISVHSMHPQAVDQSNRQFVLDVLLLALARLLLQGCPRTDRI